MRLLPLVTGELDLGRGVLSTEVGESTHLTEQECSLLGYLASRAGQNVTRESLLVDVFGYRPGVQSRAVDDAVKRLRAKIEKVPRRPFHLVSVRGVGYRFVSLEPEARQRTLLKLGDRVVDLERLQIRQEGQPPAALSAQEGRLLEVLWESTGRPVSPGELLRQVWGIRDGSQRRVVDKALYRLRSKLEDGKTNRYLKTIRGRGVVLEAVLHVAEVPPPVGPGRAVSPLTEPVFGREALIATALSRLTPGSALTLHGPAGVGKSTVAAAVAARWPGPTRLAELVGCTTVGQVEDALSAALGIDEEDSGVSRRLAMALEQSDGMLLLLDDAEAGAEALRSVLDGLRGALSGVVLLITSRRVLGSTEEQVLPVGPLSLQAARALLLSRAHASGAQIDPADPDLDRLVRGVDQLPLVLGLAAGRLRLLGVSGLVARLDQPLRVFRTRDGRGRHSSLRAALSWSWGALSPPVQELLAGITVFGGSFPLEAAEQVMPDPLEALDGLQELVDLALLRRLPDGRLAPYHGVSELIAEELGAGLAPILEALRPRLFDWLAAANGEPELGLPPQPADYARLAPALEIALSTLESGAPTPEQLARILDWVLPMLNRTERLSRLSRLSRLLPPPEVLSHKLDRAVCRHRAIYHRDGRVEGLLAEADRIRLVGDECCEGLLLGLALGRMVDSGHSRVEAVRERLEDLLPALQVDPRAEQWARNGLGWYHFRRGELDPAWASLQEALTLSRRAGEDWATSVMAYNLAGVCRAEGRLAEAEAFLHLSRQAIEATDNTSSHRQNQDMLGLVWLDQGRLDEAAVVHRELYDLQRRAGQRLEAAIQANRMGTLMGLRGHRTESTRWFELARLGFEAEGNVPRVAGVRYNLGYCAWLSGHLSEARRQFLAALSLYEQLSRQTHQGIVQSMLGRLEIEAGQDDAAQQRLRGALALLEEGRFRKHIAEASALLALALARTDPQQARRLSASALASMRSVGQGPSLPAVLVLCARTHLRLGEVAQACVLRDEAEVLCRSLGIRSDSDTGQQLVRLSEALQRTPSV